MTDGKDFKDSPRRGREKIGAAKRDRKALKSKRAASRECSLPPVTGYKPSFTDRFFPSDSSRFSTRLYRQPEQKHFRHLFLLI
jgi:hypothetical protein